MKRKSLRYRIISAIFTTPIVPRYNEDAIEKPQGYNAPRAQGLGPEAFGGAVGIGLQRAGGAMMQTIAEETAKANRIATIDSRTKLDQKEVDLLYHPENGALAKRGKDSFSIEDPTLKAFDDGVSEIEKGLGTQEQKDAFRLIAGQRRVEVDKQIQRHVHGEMKTYAEESNKASLQSTLNNIVTHYNDPDRIEIERKFGAAVIASDTDNKGLPPAAVKMKHDTWESTVHSGVIERMAIDSPVKAKEYLDANRDKMLATDIAKQEKTIKPLATKQIGMDTALELAPLLGAKPLTEVLSEARTRLKSDPDALNIAETQIKQMEAERRDQVKQEGEAAAKPVYKRVAEIQLSGRPVKLSDIPAEEWTELVRKNPEEAGKIQDAIRREADAATDRAERKADRAERKSEQGNVQQLLNWAALNGDPDSLSAANLDALYTQGLLGKEHYRSLSTKQADIRANPDKGLAIRTESQTVEDILKAVSLKQGDDKHSQAWEYIEGRKRSFVADNKRQPTRQELQDIARESVYKVDVAGSMMDKNLYQVRFDDIPKKERAEIIEAFKKRGKQFTEAEVVRVYGKAQMEGAK
jgi:hypothetical protein